MDKDINIELLRLHISAPDGVLPKLNGTYYMDTKARSKLHTYSVLPSILILLKLLTRITNYASLK